MKFYIACALHWERLVFFVGENGFEVSLEDSGPSSVDIFREGCFRCPSADSLREAGSLLTELQESNVVCIVSEISIDLSNLSVTSSVLSRAEPNTSSSGWIQP